jgi:hypothetical protein
MSRRVHAKVVRKMMRKRGRTCGKNIRRNPILCEVLPCQSITQKAYKFWLNRLQLYL